jgi:hypothetical protein
MDTPANNNFIWDPSKKLLFRFLFIYFFLYCFPFPLDAFDFLAPVAKPYYNFIDWLIPTIGKNWFHLHAHVAFPTFDKVDDSFYGLVFIYFTLILSAIGALAWSLFDRRRNNYEKLFQWLKLYLQYFLAAYLFGYGFVKIFPSQFEAITTSRLTMTVGDQSPMLLAWNFMGYSTTLMKLNGWAEVLAGLLLLFRRTATPGAILSAAIFGFVVSMDFTFNVPVRLLASHLLIISIFLILCDRRRLVNVFILNKPTKPVVYVSLINHPTWQKIFRASLVIFAICLLYSSVVKGIDAEKSFGRSAPPLVTDSLYWKQLVIDGGSWNQSGIIRFNNDNRTSYNIETDTVKHNINIRSTTDTTEKYLFSYSIVDTSHILFNGLWKKDSVKVLMSKSDPDHYLLHREKFKWITY